MNELVCAGGVGAGGRSSLLTAPWPGIFCPAEEGSEGLLGVHLLIPLVILTPLATPPSPRLQGCAELAPRLRPACPVLLICIPLRACHSILILRSPAGRPPASPAPSPCPNELHSRASAMHYPRKIEELMETIRAARRPESQTLPVPGAGSSSESLSCRAPPRGGQRGEGLVRGKGVPPAPMWASGRAGRSRSLRVPGAQCQE